MKKLNPTQDFIVMEIPKVNSAIALPDGVTVNREKQFIAIAIGPDVKTVKPGDRIVAIQQSILQVVLDGNQYFVAKEEFVIAIVKEEKDAE